MKKAVALFLTLILFICTFSMNIVNANQTDEQQIEDYVWTDTATVYSASRAARYFRTKELSDGTIGAVYYRSGKGNYFAKSYDGGLTFKNEVLLLANATDSAINDSPYVTDKNPLGRGRLEAQNPNFVELPNGYLMVFHRYNTFTGDPDNKPWSFYYASICYQISTNGGKTWSTPQVMVECQKEKALDDKSSDYGFWEPDPYIINDQLFVYYADTYTPQNLSYQHIMYCVFNDKTQTFSEPQIAQNGIEHLSRDGMSVVTELIDGNYAMVFESTRTGNTDNTFVIKMSLSKDGRNWSHPVIVATPNIVLSETAASSSEKAVCASPHIVTLPDGRVAVSYQTTDRYSGEVPDRVSYRVGTQVTVSKDIVTYDKFADIQNFADKYNNANVTAYFKELTDGPGVLLQNEFSKSASMICTNGKLMIYYNVGENTDPNHHLISEVMVSVAETGVDRDYSKLNSYLTLNSNNAKITADDYGFSIPSGTSTLLVSDKNAKKTITGFYDKNNYLLYTGGSYTASFNKTAQNIKTTSTGKALLKNTEHLNSFNASVTVAGNTSTGVMQAGFSFHLDKEDFSTNYFNTAGYTVFVRRQTKDLSKVEVAYRYCVDGESKHSYIAGSYTGIPTNDLDLKLTLEIFVNEDKFYAQVKDESGKIIINAKEAPLDITATEDGKDTVYRPAGSLALITHGIHTLSNISVTETTQLVNAEYLKARATITTSATGTNYIGFAIRAQGSTFASPGYCGYVLKLTKTSSYADGTIKLQLTRYGTNSAGETYKNLGEIDTFEDKTVLNGANASSATIIMEAEVIKNTLEVTLINYEDNSITSEYTFDLSQASKGYSVYYENGGFGFFNHGSSVATVKDIEFSAISDKLGDIMNDGLINSQDMVLMRKTLLKVYTIDKKTEHLCDINSDGEINVADLIAIKEIAG